MRRTDSKVTSSANTIESLIIDLDRRYLERHRATGIRIKLVGKRGSVIVGLSALAVVEFLAATAN